MTITPTPLPDDIEALKELLANRDALIAKLLAEMVRPDRAKPLTAAVRTAARYFDLSLESMPAAPKQLLPLLAQLTPERAERSAKTLANTRSLVKQATPDGRGTSGAI